LTAMLLSESARNRLGSTTSRTTMERFQIRLKAAGDP
jgi:hypothetical protein